MVNAAEARLRHVHGLLRVVGVGGVHAQHGHAPVHIATQPVGEGLQARVVQIGQHQVGAMGVESWATGRPMPPLAPVSSSVLS